MLKQRLNIKKIVNMVKIYLNMFYHYNFYLYFRYTIGDLHKSKITSIEWSKNGMRLFSGDKDGVIIMTEIDFYMVSVLKLVFMVYNI